MNPFMHRNLCAKGFLSKIIILEGIFFDKPFKFFRPTLLRQFLRTGAFTDDNVFPVGNSQFGWVQFIQMEYVHVLKL